MFEFTALWDTGATNSVISQSIVDKCGLVPTGVTPVHHADGTSLQETYLVNIGLPNGVAYSAKPVTKAQLTGGIEALIGMDIITTGDFAVTNFEGRTKFTFRVPSLEHFDFVPDRRLPDLTRQNKPKKKKRKRRGGRRG